MINHNFKEVLKIISLNLSNTNIKYAIIGSTNLLLQGMDVKPKDIDLVVSLEDFDKLSEVFSNFLIRNKEKLKTLEDRPAWDIKLKIHELEVQIITEPPEGIYTSKLLFGKIIKIKLDELSISCLTLAAEAQSYSQTNREHKAELIRNFLAKNRKVGEL